MALLTLRDGRTLAYTDGDPEGVPVVLFHGAPGSRGFRPRRAETDAAGVRLITFDRPGYDGSDTVDVPTVLGVASDVMELVAALGLDRFGIVAWSGGAPSAVATALVAAERVRALALVSAPGPLDEVPGGWEALGDYRRPTAEMARREPHRSARSIARHMEPFLVDPVTFLGRRRGPDAVVFDDPELGPMLDSQVTAAIAPGPAGIAGDLVAMWMPWGFALRDVAVPTTVFHAALDPHNEADAHTYAQRIPGARLVVWPDAGHLGLLTHWPEVLAAVAAGADRAGGAPPTSRYAVPLMAVEETDMSTAAPGPSAHPIEERLHQLSERREQALHAGSEAAVERQHQRGKLTARERIELLVDPGSFHELDMLARHRAHGFGIENTKPYTDGVITGWGTVEGRKVFLFSQDFTIFGGALGEVFAEKIHKVMDLAASTGAPFIGLNDGAGARIQEGVVSLAAYGGIFYRNVQASGVIPQISVILGPCAGGAVYSPAMTDFIFMVNGTSHMFITGPDVVKAATGEEVTQEELGGAMPHATKSGVANFVYDDEETCLDQVRYLISFLPSNNLEDAPYYESNDAPDRSCDRIVEIMPDSPNQAYDMKEVIADVVDDSDFLEVSARFGMNIVCGFGRLGGNSVGIVGNQPKILAGALDIDASEKAARFVRTCDAFNIPIITFVDVPGFIPGTKQEHGGIIRHGAKLLYAYCESSVPRIQVITRKGYGGAYVVMDSKSIGSDIAYAWPTAEIAVMNSHGAANILLRRELAESDDPVERKAQWDEEYSERFANPYNAAERGYVDDVIDPRDTRRLLIDALAMLRTKKERLPARKHGNVPL